MEMKIVYLASLLVLLRFGAVSACGCMPKNRDEEITAICHLKPNPSQSPQQPISGWVELVQREPGSDVHVSVRIQGVDLDKQRERGLHIHDQKTITPNCEAALGHYNPFKVDHGSRTSNPRHPGDFGNVEVKDDKSITTSFSVSGLELSGEYSVIGRPIVLHGHRDDLGKGGDAGSKASGNAGPRIACCIIEKR